MQEGFFQVVEGGEFLLVDGFEALGWEGHVSCESSQRPLTDYALELGEMQLWNSPNFIFCETDLSN